VSGAESGWHATTRPPMTGVEVLQLALLGIALFLVGARLRVRALRRKQAPAEPRRRAPAQPSRRGAELAYEESVAAPISARRMHRDEWPFPDPDEPARTALLPSTATARRRARALAMSDDRR
jgi:hypothetical protein